MGKTVAVLGLSKYGRSIAEALAERGAEVLVADQNEELVRQYADKVTYAMVADLADDESIRGLGLGNMDVVVIAMAMHLEASIMCVMCAKEAGAPYVLVKAKDDRMEQIMKRIGADEVIQPEKEIGIRSAAKIMSRNMLEIYDLEDSMVMVEMKPRPEWVGRSLRQLNLRKEHGIQVAALYSGNKAMRNVDPDEPLREDQTMIVIMNEKDAEKI